MHTPSTDVQPISPAATPQALAAPAEVPAGGRLACCCSGCGSAVTFDALIVSCRCADDGRSTDSVLH